MFVGFNLTFFPQNTLGLRGMPRRIAEYNSGAGWNFLNMLRALGAYILGIGVLVTVWNLFRSDRVGEISGDNPVGRPDSSEWACSSPPPPHNFAGAARDSLRAPRLGCQPPGATDRSEPHH